MYILDSSTLTIRDFEPSETPFVKGHVFCIKSDNDGCLSVSYTHLQMPESLRVVQAVI